ncbi:hypothetical protein NDS46_07285 [Paenibacillus thiaminolyticus]|uniref:hypothetical protein n=1 Tax=Paenibacillus thiaminolyticus TaxID=49283 RepID=UPI00232FFE77|nr:hypothetical protein [Paenibacillus thiaminolyticus]WCF09667.1 hypothetical protein NDS46_07285 [Paenibacillus thiaminolyticus]WII38880.1 hypothetical protein O0V01_07160 [Paenibacillus thiaminolyticus]
MKWQQVRELFPDQFVLLSILDYREEDDKKIVTELAPVRAISEKDANREFFNAKPGNIVYHTSNEECVIHLRKDPLLRVRRGS